MIRAALVQLTSSDDPEANLPATLAAIERAAGEGADWILTPEVTNCVSSRRARQEAVLRPEGEDRTLAAVREAAARLGVPVLIGSLALRGEGADGRFVNRSFAIGRTGRSRRATTRSTCSTPTPRPASATASRRDTGPETGRC